MTDKQTIDFVSIIGAITVGVLLGIFVLSQRSAAEKKTVVYCVEKPSACKTKYDYYKLENQK